MKMSAKRILSVLLALALIATMVSGGLVNIARADAVNLLSNSGFEDFAGGNFTGWNFWGGNNGNTQLSQVDGRTDKSAKITVDNNNNTVNLYQAINLDADKEYVLTAWVKTEDIALQWGGANGVYLSISDGNGMASITPSDYIKAAADWQKFEITVNGADYTGYADGIFFDIRAEYLTGSIYIDDVSLTVKEDEPTPPPATDPDELLLNSGFEEFVEGSFTNWYFWKGSHGNATAAQVNGRTGKAVKLTVNDNSSIANLSQTITLESEGEYTFSVWVKIENIVRQWETAPGVYLTLRNNNTVVSKSSAINTDSDWQKLEFTIDAATLAAGEKTFDLTIEYVKGDFYFDDASLKKKEATPIVPDEDEGKPLKNTGFEKFEEGAFKHWTLWRGNQGNTVISQVTGRTDNAAKITVDNNNNIVNLYQSVTLEADKWYKLSVFVKTENIALQWDGAQGVYLALSYNNNIVLAKSDSIKTNSDWTELTVTVSGGILSGSEQSVQFDIVSEYLTGDIYVDDAALTEVSNPTTPDPNEPGNNPDPTPDDNAFSNGDFEIYESGAFKKWSLWRGNQGNTIIEQAAGRTGNAAKLIIDNNNNIVNLYQSVKLEAGKKYKLTVFVKTENIALQWDGAQGVYLALSYNNNIVLAKSASIKTDSDWTKLELTVSADILQGNEWQVQLDVISEYLTGSVYVDDASIAEVTDTPDIPPSEDEDDQGGSTPEEEDTAPLKNSSFEKFQNGNFNHWTFWGGNKGNTKLEQADGRTGKAAKFVIDSDENIVRLYQEVELDPTLEYTFSVWVKTENTALQWATAPGVYVNLALDNQKVLASEAVNKDGDWTKLSVVINGAVLSGKEWSVCFDIAAEFIKGNVYIDDATLEVTGKATPIAAPDEDELLKNNSFEIYSAGNFANWTSWKGNKGNTKFEQVNGRTGKGVKITVDDNNNIVNLYQEVKLDPTKEYTFSVWVKTEDIDLQWAGAQGVYLNFKYNNTVILMSKPVAVDSDWTKLELKVNGGILKGDEWGVSIDIAAEYLTGVVYIDDASVKVTGEGTAVPDEDPDEKLYNSGFELYSGYNFARWSLNKGNNGNTLLSQVKGKTGNAAKIVVDDNNNIVSLYQEVKLDPTKEYTFSVWVKTEDIALQWAGAEGIYLALGYNNLTPTRSKAIKADSDWTMLEVKVGGGDIPADAWGIQFAIMSEYLTGTIYIDDASMRVTGDYVPRPDSFLENGGFDTPDEDTIIAGWNAYAEDLFSVLERNTEKTYNSSPASASILNADNKSISYWEQTLDNLDTAKTYLLSGFIFSDMIVSEEGGAAVYVEFLDAEGNLIRTYRTSFVKGEQTDWTAFEMKLAFPENCVKMIVKAALVKAVGTAYFDEFSLAEYDETTDTAEEGIKDNMYALETEDEDIPVDTEKAGIPVLVWFIIGGAVLLLAVATVIIFFVIKKKKTIKI